MLKKLRIKFICINMVLLMAMLCAVLGLVVHFTRMGLEAESLRMMQSAAVMPARPGNMPQDIRLPCLVLRMDREGRLLAEGGGDYNLTGEELASLVEEVFAAGTPSGVLEERGLRFLWSGGPERRLVFASVAQERAALAQLARTCLLAGFAGFWVLLLISFFLARWAVRPVERAWEQQRQFVADASHELKTPLTVIITDAELLQEKADGASREQLAGSILTMSRQMRGLVESLLELARLDSGTAGRKHVRLDFSQLIAQAVLPFEAVFFEQGLTLTEHISGGIAVTGDPDRLRQAAEIFLDNAQKYTSPGGEVSVTLERRGRNRCLFSVAGPGEAIPQGELKNIFKRFYRLDRARSMNGSYGLGLSIAWTIVSEHHGRIWAESAGGINTFFIELKAKGP